MNKLDQFLKSGNRNIVVSLVGLFLVVAGITWGAFTLLGKQGVGTTSKSNGTDNIATRPGIDLNLPKTEVCPINGLKFTSAERKVWEARRPAAIMVENHADSRPLEGLSRADFLYEAVAEGGITRFLTIFYCGAAANDVKIAPVRSARVYFINWASEYGDRPLYVHVGGANDFCPTCYGGVKPAGTINPKVDALGLLEKIGWRVPSGNDFDAAYDSGYPVFFRNPERLGHAIATEHTMTVSTDAMYENAESRGLAAKAKNGVTWNNSFTAYKFVDDAKLGSPKATDISFKFWSNKPDYNVEWKYDSVNNQYMRFNGGEAMVDLAYKNVQLTAKNVIVMQIDEQGPVDSEGHMFYQNIGKGDILVFQNGNVIKGTWSKATRTDRTKFMDENGKEISLVRGVTWVEGIPTGNTVDYH